MKWLNSVISVITAVGSLPPRILLTFLGVLTVIVVLVILLVRATGLQKLSLTQGVEFSDEGPLLTPVPKAPVKKPRPVAKKKRVTKK